MLPASRRLKLRPSLGVFRPKRTTRLSDAAVAAAALSRLTKVNGTNWPPRTSGRYGVSGLALVIEDRVREDGGDGEAEDGLRHMQVSCNMCRLSLHSSASLSCVRVVCAASCCSKLANARELPKILKTNANSSMRLECVLLACWLRSSHQVMLSSLLGASELVLTEHWRSESEPPPPPAWLTRRRRAKELTASAPLSRGHDHRLSSTSLLRSPRLATCCCRRLFNGVRCLQREAGQRRRSAQEDDYATSRDPASER